MEENERRKVENNLEDEQVQKLVQYLHRLGIDRLPRDISDERFARRIVESQLLISQIEGRAAFEEQLQEEFENRALSIHSQLFDKASNYNNLILSLGYAGFFAIWNFVQSDLRKADLFIVAALLGVSLMTFIYWTLRVALLNAKSMAGIATVYGETFDTRDEKKEALLKKEAENSMLAMRLQRIWPFWFGLSIGTGFSAGFLLLFALFLKILGLNFSFGDTFVSFVKAIL